jgi:hypothetical protein
LFLDAYNKKEGNERTVLANALQINSVIVVIFPESWLYDTVILNQLGVPRDSVEQTSIHGPKACLLAPIEPSAELDLGGGTRT